MFADLHIHSWYSDGTLSPEEIIEKAKSQNVSLISVCDHNLIDAYVELENLCAVNNIKNIIGVEISSLTDDMEYHILAYGFDIQSKALNELLQHSRSVNMDIGNSLIQRISMDYPSVSLEEFSKYERNRRNGGWESIDYLRSKGLDDYGEFVRKYGSPTDKKFLHPAEVIKIIHDSGGYAVLTHPGGYYTEQNIEICEKIATEFLNIGIDGFECYYPYHTFETTEFFVKFCRDHNLMITAGSDEHGGFGDLSSRGYYIGAIKVEIEQLNLKKLID